MNKKEVIKFRVTPLEKAVIQKKADNSGLKVSAYCRNTSLGRKIGYRLTEEELEAYRDLSKFRADFIRLANFFRTKNPELEKQIQETSKLLNEHLNNFR